jgi:hypothetical protein
MTGAGQPGPAPNRTPAKRKARQLAKYLRSERPNYAYLKEVFRHLRDELSASRSPLAPRWVGWRDRHNHGGNHRLPREAAQRDRETEQARLITIAVDYSDYAHPHD